MPRSPTSSEDEMAQSFSDYSDESISGSSKEDAIYESIKVPTEMQLSFMEDFQGNTVVIRVIIPDLQQTILRGNVITELACCDSGMSLDPSSVWPISKASSSTLSLLFVPANINNEIPPASESM
ncbi:SH3 and multiple ankyrin repeat domains protein 2-like isoform X1 [Tachysurus ichikawai]